MKFRAMLQVTLLAALILMCVQACSGNGTSSTASSTSRSDFTAETRLEVDELEIKPEMNSNILKIREMNLDAGQLVFLLSTPDGHVQWEETFTAPATYQHTFDLDMTPGTWKLEIKLDNATGNYDIQWKASN